VYLTKASALIDYYLQIHGIEVPDWLRDERLCFEKPYYHSKRLSDFEKVRLIYTNPARSGPEMSILIWKESKGSSDI